VALVEDGGVRLTLEACDVRCLRPTLRGGGRDLLVRPVVEEAQGLGISKPLR